MSGSALFLVILLCFLTFCSIFFPSFSLFLVKCRNVPSATHCSFEFWLLQFLLSVSDVQPDVVLCLHFLDSVLFTSPLVSSSSTPPPTFTLSEKKNHFVCRSSFVSRENQQIILSVLNKLLYFDMRELGGCAFLGLAWLTLGWARGDMDERRANCIFSARP